VSLRDRLRTQETFEVDDAVRRVLKEWSQEKASDVGRLNLARAAKRLSPEQRNVLIARLAEISLGVLAVLEKQEG
jgi:hypothetical protein